MDRLEAVAGPPPLLSGGINPLSLKFDVPEDPTLEDRYVREFHEARVKWDFRWCIFGSALGMSALARGVWDGLALVTAALVGLRALPGLLLLLLPKKAYCRWRRSLLIGIRCVRTLLCVCSLSLAPHLNCSELFVTLSESSSLLFNIAYQLPFKDTVVLESLTIVPVVGVLATSPGLCTQLLSQPPASPCGRILVAYRTMCSWTSFLAGLVAGVPLQPDRCYSDSVSVCTQLMLYLLLMMGYVLPLLLLYVSELRSRMYVLHKLQRASPAGLQAQFWLSQNFAVALVLVVSGWMAVPRLLQWAL